MKSPDSGTPSPSDADDSTRVTFEDLARRAARLALMASLPLMAAVLIFMLVRGEEIPAEMWLVAVIWAGWVVYTLRGLGREKRP
jgi:hypothetical protein